MLNKFISYLFVTVLIISFGCSSSEQTTSEEESNDEVYVFDEVPVDSTIEIEETESKPITKAVSHYIIQIGAFTTREKAELFASKSGGIITDGITVSYNHEVNLFVVQLNEKFKNKNDAMGKRDSLRLIDDFKDAWIITVY